MSTSTIPRNPVDNWESVRDDWIATIERFVSDAELWARNQDWMTKRHEKTIDEDRLGSYVVSRLLIHTIFGRFLLDPVCRYVVGAEGLVDIMVMPSLDSLSVVRLNDGHWYLHGDRAGQVTRRPWSEEIFVETVGELGRKA